MNKVLVFIVCLTAAGNMTAQKVSVEEAKDAARLYLGEKTTKGSDNDLRLAYTQMSVDGSDSEDLFVFNHGNDGGFVVVAGDMRAGELILGYSYSGTFNYSTTSDNLKWWLKEYAKEIDYMRENIDEVKATRGKAGVKAGASEVLVSPLLGDLKWHQQKPFNNLCKTPKGEEAYTGCVATAMSMIMYYYKWPVQGCGSHTNRNDSKQSVNYYESVYDWDNMLVNYDKNYNGTQAQAVAKLAYDCGVSVDMLYGTGGSGAYSSTVPQALKRYFSYSDDIRYIPRMNQSDWDEIIKEELLGKRPVYYSGSSDESGHAFVCDGCEVRNGIDYFHFNFGWGGERNGYFRTHMIDYKNGQGIVIGIMPEHKVKVDGLYFSLANDTAAYVSSPDNVTEYSGKVVIPASIVSDGKTYKVTKITSFAFSGCTGLTDVVIPSSVNTIASDAFSNCPMLQSVKVEWADEMPSAEHGAFSDEVTSNVMLIVPEGRLDFYSVRYPWCFFTTLCDTKGQTVRYSAWEQFGGGSGTYKYDAYFGGSTVNKINIRSKEGSNDECQVVIKNLYDATDFLIKYNKSDKTCQVPPQPTGRIVSDADGIQSNLMVSDVPSCFDEASYDDYPCTYSPVTGQFRLCLYYYVGEKDGAAIGEDIFQMKGTGFKDFSVSISDVAGVVEKSDNTATQKITFSMADDVDRIRYAVLEDSLYFNDELRIFAKQIAEGKIESKVKTKGIVNVATVTYPNPGNYVVIVISEDADGKYYGNYDIKTVTFQSKKDWKEVAKGTFTYNYWFSKEDGSPRKDKDKVLSQHISDPSRWKISNIFNGVDFEFTWIQETDSVYFEAQRIGVQNESYGDVYVENNNAYFSVEEDTQYGVPSCFDRASETFRFNNVYCVYAGYFGEGYMGVETFTVPGLATEIQMISQPTANSQQPTFNLSGQIVDDSYKGIVIKGGKKVLVR